MCKMVPEDSCHTAHDFDLSESYMASKYETNTAIIALLTAQLPPFGFTIEAAELTGKKLPLLPVAWAVMVEVSREVNLSNTLALRSSLRNALSYVVVSTSVVPLAVIVVSCVWTEDTTVVRVIAG
jgi:hypothetical protein